MLKYVKNISKVMLYIVVLVILVYLGCISWIMMYFEGGGVGVYKLKNDVIGYLWIFKFLKIEVLVLIEEVLVMLRLWLVGFVIVLSLLG